MEIVPEINSESEKRRIVTEWVDKYSNDLFVFALKRVSGTETARDVVQTTFLSAFNSFEKFEGRSSPKSWLMSILKNKIVDHYRKAYQQREVELTDTTASDFNEQGHWTGPNMPTDWETTNVLDNPEFRKVFYGCIDALPDQWNRVIKIKYLEAEHEPEELGLTRTNYWKMLERARRQLRKCLEINWFKQN